MHGIAYDRRMSTEPATTWIPDASTFGARLALIRWRMGWNLTEAARECDITQNSWANWEAGSMPRQYVEAVTKIVWRTKVDKFWLMTGEGSPEPETAGPTVETRWLAPVTPIFGSKAS